MEEWDVSSLVLLWTHKFSKRLFQFYYTIDTWQIINQQYAYYLVFMCTPKPIFLFYIKNVLRCIIVVWKVNSSGKAKHNIWLIQLIV